eukprot:TRINITY_DN6514_c0_g1_i1.p1 TRINITY_DN6514_c0_g1~~TRINITY_DN6514_c0_g1_i1.p1  ORF type:complete len:234 (-),score=29.11 TRINITY_DN6514_c0_g1_i1:278-979(-)
MARVQPIAFTTARVSSSLAPFWQRLTSSIKPLYFSQTKIPSLRSRSTSQLYKHRDSIASDARYSNLFLKLNLPRNFSAMSDGVAQAPSSVYDFTVKDIKGKDVKLDAFKGKVLLILNVASQCGFTNSNYTELNVLYGRYRDKGLEILAFPCNQFGGQEPGTNEQIEQFACTRYKAEFPLFDKVDVNGDSAIPLYKFLKSSKGGLFGDDVKWNFTKFLVDKDGKKDVKKLLGVK